MHSSLTARLPWLNPDAAIPRSDPSLRVIPFHRLHNRAAASLPVRVVWRRRFLHLWDELVCYVIKPCLRRGMVTEEGKAERKRKGHTNNRPMLSSSLSILLLIARISASLPSSPASLPPASPTAVRSDVPGVKRTVLKSGVVYEWLAWLSLSDGKVLAPLPPVREGYATEEVRLRNEGGGEVGTPEL